MYPHYGLAPHSHVGITKDASSFIGSTHISPKDKWPKHFTEDHEAEGCGTYYCPICMDGSPVKTAEEK